MSKTSSNQHLYAIYEEELHELTYHPKGLLDKFIHTVSRRFSSNTDLTYTISVPASEFLRGELFCEDISEAINKPFTQTNLISILLDDFLYQANNRKNFYGLFRELHSRIPHPIKVYHYRGEQEVLHIHRKIQGEKRIDCTIKRKKALRLEVILSDLATIEPDITFSVKDLIQVLYSCFIEKYKNGTLTKELENIVKRLA
ncbi:hypothetical protein WQ54_24535 [Bacillus sp. SA1-12]|uniref:hypothetical protein n=1 Tax=Bacillus sp. SA1-12 TaxID=1455638 RepID=UPI0006271B18|nr:hypothetical protein [Bacillus sp. SA1-12]KKI89534.1 hypothetical protein WQ54_24535 [Bacillus sp. SA1-12]